MAVLSARQSAIAIGLPCEGMTPQKQRKYFGEIRGHRLLFGRGMYSDDTEHTLMVAQALIASGGEIEAFRNSFSAAVARLDLYVCRAALA